MNKCCEPTVDGNFFTSVIHLLSNVKQRALAGSDVSRVVLVGTELVQFQKCASKCSQNTPPGLVCF